MRWNPLLTNWLAYADASGFLTSSLLVALCLVVKAAKLLLCIGMGNCVLTSICPRKVYRESMVLLEAFSPGDWTIFFRCFDRTAAD
jgi:hypothetical protein